MKTFCLMLMTALALRAEDVKVTLTWAANPEPDIAYYNLKVGTQPGVYPTVVTVPAVVFTLPLPQDTLHYAVVTAVNTSGLESEPSARLVFQVFKAGAGKVPSAPVGLSKPAGLQASLETSTDLKVWSIVATKELPAVPRMFVRAAIAHR